MRIWAENRALIGAWSCGTRRSGSCVHTLLGVYAGTTIHSCGLLQRYGREGLLETEDGPNLKDAVSAVASSFGLVFQLAAIASVQVVVTQLHTRGLVIKVLSCRGLSQKSVTCHTKFHRESDWDMMRWRHANSLPKHCANFKCLNKLSFESLNSLFTIGREDHEHA